MHTAGAVSGLDTVVMYKSDLTAYPYNALLGSTLFSSTVLDK
jgi:hypothetical protein